MPTEIITLDGHIIDSLTLSKVLDILVSAGVDYEIRRFEIGRTHDETSHAEILVRAPDEETLQRALHEVQQHGAIISQENAELQPAPQDGVFPDGFYSTTNLETFVRIEGNWVPVERIEMDCGIRVTPTDSGWRAECVPLHRARKGDLFVVGTAGVRVTPMPRRGAESVFHFMGSEVSIEKPKTRIVQAVARTIRDTKARGQKVLFVGGPAIVHTGAAPFLERIIRAGWIDVLFAGNALATHDIEYALYGTSLGIALDTGTPETHGHEHHLRAINTIRALGGIRQAVEKGVLKGGIMHACVVARVHYVLAGSIRDDGPLPRRDHRCDAGTGRHARGYSGRGACADGRYNLTLYRHRQSATRLGDHFLRGRRRRHRHQAHRPRLAPGVRYCYRLRFLPERASRAALWRGIDDAAPAHVSTRPLRPAL